VDAVRRIRRALFALGAVLVVGTVGYIALGFRPLDALYQTVTTITTVGFREVRPLSAIGKVFTILLILVGVGTALYALVELLDALIEGHLRQHLERRRMNREIGRLTGHVIICGWGRVGRASAQYLTATGERFVVIDRDAARLEGLPYPSVVGGVTHDPIP
jgi:voltage-gated potassium channel